MPESIDDLLNMNLEDAIQSLNELNSSSGYLETSLSFDALQLQEPEDEEIPEQVGWVFSVLH